MRERDYGVGRGFQIPTACETHAAARSQVVIAVTSPMKLDAGRQRHMFDFRATAERVALTLHNQRRSFQGCKMIGPQLFGFARRVKRISDTHQTLDGTFRKQLIGDHARHASTHGLSADQQLLAIGKLRSDGLDCGPKFRREGVRSRRRASLSTGSAGRHVRELEPADGDVAVRQQSGQGFKERAGHGRTRTMRQYNADRRVRRSGVKKFRHSGAIP